MSTSGRIQSGGFSGGSYFYMQWQLAGQDINGNYSVINWQWGLSIAGGGWYWGSNAIKSVSGYINGGNLVFGANTWSNLSGAGDHQLLAGSFTIGHNSDGNKSFDMSSTGYSYGDGNFGNSGAWDLPAIPRHASLNNLSMDGPGITAYDEGPVWLEFANPAGTAVDAWVESPAGGTRIWTDANSGTHHDFNFDTAHIQALQQSSPNSNAFTIRIGIHDSLGGDNWDYRDRTMYIKNDTGQANPTFSTFTFKDNNATTAAITGNNQYLIQGYSDLLVTIPSANKATPKKFATMSSYSVSIGKFSNNAAYSTSTINYDVGAVSDVSGAQLLTVRAVDSRGNSTAVQNSVTILPYSAPIVKATATRANGFDDALILHVTGTVSPLTVSGTDKNHVNSTSGVQYRVATDSGAYGSWTNVTSTQAAGTGAIAVPTDAIIAAQGATSSNHSFSIQVMITDGITSTTQTLSVTQGLSIFRIGKDSKLYYKEVEFSTAFNETKSIFVSGLAGVGGNGTWQPLGLSGFIAGNGTLYNSTNANGNYIEYPIYLTAGTYSGETFFCATTNAPLVDVTINGNTAYTVDLYSASTTERIIDSSNIVITQSGIQTWRFKANGLNAAATGYYIRMIGMRLFKTS